MASIPEIMFLVINSILIYHQGESKNDFAAKTITSSKE
jgi:hypothetical protein